MKFVVNKEDVNKKLDMVSKAISSKSGNDILEGVCINLCNGTLSLTGSDSNLTIKTSVDCISHDNSNKTIVVDIKMIKDIVRSLSGEISFELEDNILRIECGKSMFNLVCKSTEDGVYPSTPNVVASSSITIDSTLLKKAISGVSFAVALDETRPILKGICFNIENNKLDLVGLDGYRLSKRSLGVELSNCENFQAVVDGKSFSDAIRSIDDNVDVNLTFSRNHAVVAYNNTNIMSRLLEGKYVNYMSLIDSSYVSEVDCLKLSANTDEFKSAIERASLLADKSTPLIRLSIDKECVTISANSVTGKVRETVYVKSNHYKDSLEISFNARYLLDALKATTESTITLLMKSPISPCLIKECCELSNPQYMVLPVRTVNNR